MPATASAPVDVALSVDRELTLGNAGSVCHMVDEWLERAPHARSLVIDLTEVKTCDVVGLAVLRDVRDRCAVRDVEFTIVPGATVTHALVRARLVEALSAVPARPGDAHTIHVSRAPGAGPLTLAGARRLALRRPTWEELPLFEAWAGDCVLEDLVGSDLLYDCRHRGAGHPDVTPRVFGDATSMTALLEVTGRDRPIGYVRLFGIDLVQRIAFLEVVVARASERQRGWGILGARLVIAWGLDVLGLYRIEAKAYARNYSSNRALRGNGFAVEGLLREASANGRERDDLVVYGILAHEARNWLARDRFPSFALWPSPADATAMLA
jgi:anti-anti-sigma regulatory factor